MNFDQLSENWKQKKNPTIGNNPEEKGKLQV